VTASVADYFIAELQRELRKQRLSLLDADFLTAVEAGAVDHDQIGAWAQVFYVATRDGRLSIGNFYANSPDDPVLRRELAENIYEEETGQLSGVGRCHMDVFFDFLDAFGISREDVDTISLPFDRPTAQGRAIGADEYFIELSAYGLSVEAPNAEFCQRLRAALSEQYGFDETALMWFSMHAALDGGHGEEFRKYVARAARQPNGLERVRNATRELSVRVKAVWDGFGMWQ
jgi:pyrroloquinoline quinone (PQQ) biosynthesis protein C